MGGALSLKNVRYPYVRTPMTYEVRNKFTATGETRTTADGIELIDEKKDLNPFEIITEKFFEDLLIERQAIKKAKHKFIDADLEKLTARYPALNKEHILDLKAQFQTFDINQDGLIDFQELCLVLDEVGDQSDMGKRKQYFKEMDEDSSGGVDFEEYLAVLNLVQAGDTVGAIGRQGAESAQKVRQLSIVQQLDHGLF